MEAGPRDTAQGTEHLTAGGEPEQDEDRLSPDGPDDTVGGVTADGPEPEEMFAGGPEVEVELRPQRRLRIWQLAPIVGLAAVGSLMFAFPLAFDFGDSGAVIAMLGLLICSCAAGWGMMAARRVGYALPGLPPRGSGSRPDWRVVLAYVDPVPEDERRHAAGEVLGERFLVARQDRRRPRAGVAQELVQRRLVGDRDADERRVERERDERRHGQPVAAAVELRDDDGDARRPAAEERALLGPAVYHGAEPS